MGKAKKADLAKIKAGSKAYPETFREEMIRLVQAIAPDDCARYKSAGLRPVRFAIRVNMRGPISSWSWKEKTKSGQPMR